MFLTLLLFCLLFLTELKSSDQPLMENKLPRLDGLKKKAKKQELELMEPEVD